MNSAYDQLTAEGYIESAVGSGSYVARGLFASDRGRRTTRASAVAHLSRRGKELSGAVISASSYQTWARPLSHSSAALDLFPVKVWKRLYGEELERLPRSILGYGDPRGYAPLRAAIAEHVGRTRGFAISQDCVIVVSGSQQGLDVLARTLLDPDDLAAVEDPGYLGARAAFRAAGATLRAVPVDDEGINISSPAASSRDIRIAYVTPSHQFPLGTTMSAARRLALLAWASARNAWILEDDYDGEYRYAGSPLSALAALDKEQRVVYIGTFSKVLFPAMRLGFMIVPPELAERIAAARSLTDRHSPTLEQATLAAFIARGHFGRHVRRMRALYAQRRRTLTEALSAQLGDAIEIDAPETGLHVIAWLPTRIDDREAASLIAKKGLLATPLSAYAMRPLRRGALLLGFANSTVNDIEKNVKELRGSINALLRR